MQCFRIQWQLNVSVNRTTHLSGDAMQLHWVLARPVCSARLCQARHCPKLGVLCQPPASRSRASLATHKLIVCCDKRSPATSATGTDRPDEDWNPSKQGRTASACLQNATELFRKGESLVKCGQVQQGTELLTAAQRQAAEARVKLAIKATYSDKVDVNKVIKGTLSDEEMQSTILSFLGVFFLSVWAQSGVILGLGFVVAAAVGIAVTSLSTVSDYISQHNIPRLLIWYAILLVAVPQAIVVSTIRKREASLFGVAMTDAQAISHRLLADLATGAEVPLFPRQQQSHPEYREKVLELLQGFFTVQMVLTTAFAVAKDDVDKQNDQLKRSFKKMGIDVDQIDDEW